MAPAPLPLPLPLPLLLLPPPLLLLLLLLPAPSSAPRMTRSSTAACRAAIWGLSSQGKVVGCTPRPHMVTTSWCRGLASTSAACVLRMVSMSFSLYRRRHTPGAVRPARPFLCSALDWEMRLVSRALTPLTGSYTGLLLSPQSTT